MPATSDERDRSLAQLQSGLTRASHLVDQMLQLARLDPESGLPDPQPVDLATLAEAVCADLGPLILDKNLDFALDAAPGCIVTGQAEWLRVLIRNLVDNAIRYTPAGGRCVSASPRTGHCRLCVSDSGPGIPAGERDAVFAASIASTRAPSRAAAWAWPSSPASPNCTAPSSIFRWRKTCMDCRRRSSGSQASSRKWGLSAMLFT